MENIEIKKYNIDGKESGKVKLSEKVFGVKFNGDLLHQVVVSMESNARANTAHTKDRSEVSGGGRKPWRQKGTGSARHGSRRSPIWVGGGVAFGPRNERNYDKKINSKMRAKALAVSLSQKLRDEQILFLDKIKLSETKTNQAENILQNLSKIDGFNTINTKKENNIFLVLSEKDDIIKDSFKNVANVTIGDVHNLNPVNILKYRYIIMSNPEKCNEFLLGRLLAKNNSSKSKEEKE